MQVGYLGVVVPKQDFWQGFHIDDRFASQAQSALTRMRADKQATTGTQVIEPFGADPSLVEAFAKLGVPIGLAPADQSLLGGFCASITTAALVLGQRMGLQSISLTTDMDIPQPEAIIGTLGFAIHAMIQREFFYIESEEKAGGMRTMITPLAVSTANEARDTINSLPVVTQIKRRLDGQPPDGASDTQQFKEDALTTTTIQVEPCMTDDPRVAAAAKWLQFDDSAYEQQPDAAMRAAREMLRCADAVDPLRRPPPSPPTPALSTVYQYIPWSVDAEPTVAGFDTIDELFAITFIANFRATPGFKQFSVDISLTGTLLMAEFDDGRWFVVGKITGARPDLPRWRTV